MNDEHALHAIPKGWQLDLAHMSGLCPPGWYWTARRSVNESLLIALALEIRREMEKVSPET